MSNSRRKRQRRQRLQQQATGQQTGEQNRGHANQGQQPIRSNRLTAVLDNQPRQNRYLLLFLVNVIGAFIWQFLFPLFGLVDFLIGFVVGFLIIWLYDRAYGQRAYYLAYFIVYVIWAIILSNISLAKIIIQPRPRLNPGIIAVPLTVSTGLEIMILASVITLTPGTISVDLGKQPDRGQVLYVHNLTVDDPEQFRQSIKSTFERLLLRITRGGEA